ncbi:phosphoribosyltransferase-like protein [Shewanella frigidimarina]|uniref:phosphoribosyltransferase-like protein n=1 Tax=Shewanella frigidimarina TaxID=56812 RepID=UPI003D7AE611
MGIWSGIERHKFDNWCQQYASEEEKVILGLLLNQLVYRSKAQVKSLLNQAFDKSIPQKLHEILQNEKVFENMELFKSNSYPSTVLIVPVIRDTEPPTKSGPLVARLLKKMVNINDKMMRWPWSLGNLNDIETIIFIDDFVGTGEQFLTFCEKHVDEKVFGSKINILYAPITANQQGLNNIAAKRPDIHVCPIEIVTDEDNFFTAVKNEFELTHIEVLELDTYYSNFMKKINLDRLGRKVSMVKGYGGLALTYAYEHGTPNGSLPLLWANSDVYTSLFSR